MSRILLIIDHFYPEIGSAPNLFYELGSELKKNGNEVIVLTTFPRSYYLNKPEDKYKGKIFLKETIENMDIFRIKELPVPKDNLLLRGIEQFWNAMILPLIALFLKKPDIIIVYSPPLPLAFTSWILSRAKKCKIIVNIQDLYPKSIIDLGLLKNSFLIYLFRMIEYFVYKRSDFLTVHSRNNERYLLEHGANPKKIKIIYNWVDTDNIQPIQKLDEFEGINLKNKFVISYAGILSIPQGLEVIIDAAKLLEQRKDIIFLLAGDGFVKEDLIKRANSLSLTNIIFLPFQMKENYLKLLGCSDVSLVCLREDVATPVVPGKLMSIMASARAVIASMPTTSDAADIIKNANCGVAIRAGDSNALANTILTLYTDENLKNLFGLCGRIYVEEHFSLTNAINDYKEIFKNLNPSHNCQE